MAAEPPDCGCIAAFDINEGGITGISYCPMHKAASAMLKALGNAIDISQRASEFLPGAWGGIPANQAAVAEHLERLRSFCNEAIAQARGQEVEA